MLFESFLNFDNAVFQWIGNVFGPGTNTALDWLFNFVTMLGDAGWFAIVLSLLFLIPNKTRKTGVIMAFSLIFELLLVNIIMKPAFDRPRPYDLEIGWWVQAYQSVFPGGTLVNHVPGDMSFPSGHTAAFFAVMPAWCFGSKRAWMGKARRYSYFGIVLAILVGFSRIYLGVHYPTDVIAGVFAGVLCALLAVLLFQLIEKGFDKVNEPWCRFNKKRLPKAFW